MAIIVIVALLAGSAALVVGTLAADDPWPDEWDPRLTDLVAFVESEKGAPFDHPVEVVFLDEAAFEDEVQAPEDQLSDEDRADLELGSATLRAFGLAEGDLDLLAAMNDVDAGGTLAYYDPDERRIVIRGAELTDDVRPTVVHELTHAWQDQQDQLDAWDEDLEPDAADALLAVIEGDASRVEEAYVAGLPPEEQEAYQAGQQELVDGFQPEDVPDFLITQRSWPYALGPAFLAVVGEARGQRDAAPGVFDDLPTTSEQLIDVAAYLGDDAPGKPPEVDWPSEDAESRDEGGLGALFWYLALADRVDPLDALAVADAWEADAYVVWERDDETCVDAVVRVEPTGEGGLGGAAAAEVVGAWADGLADAELAVDGDELALTTCDPGPDADLDVGDRSGDVLVYPVVRLYLYAGLAQQGADPVDDAELYACYSEAFLGAASLEELLDPDLSEARIAELHTAAGEACL